MEDLTSKKCPFCQEDINIDAKKCRHCGNWLSKYEEEKDKSSAENAGDALFGCIFPLLKVAAPLLIAYYTVPSYEKLEREATNSAVECIVDSYSNNELVNMLGGDDASRLWSMLINANEQQIKTEFEKKNSIAVYKKKFWSSAKIYNYKCREGETIMFSIFGFNIPMIDIDDIEL
ncbi:MAG: hypothetical protein SNF93_03665 [Rikenellaceae bacterium]